MHSINLRFTYFTYTLDSLCDRNVVGSTPGRVTIKWLVLGWVTVRTGIPSWYITNHQGQLSLPSLQGIGKSSTGQSCCRVRGGVYLCRMEGYTVYDPTGMAGNAPYILGWLPLRTMDNV